MFVKIQQQIIHRQMLVNGIVNQWDETMSDICCGKCGVSLLQTGGPVTQAYKLLQFKCGELAQQFKYCSNCGEKIELDIVFDALEIPNNEKNESK